MKKLAIISLLVVAVTSAFAGVYASASAALPQSTAQRSVGPADPVASSIPAQLLTVRCNGRKGELKFSAQELNIMLDLSQAHPELEQKVCKVFTKRA